MTCDLACCVKRSVICQTVSFCSFPASPEVVLQMQQELSIPSNKERGQGFIVVVYYLALIPA